jgi:hypothetical protein
MAVIIQDRMPKDPNAPCGAAPTGRSPAATADQPCCGPPAGPPSAGYERPGYNVCGFVSDFIDTAAGPVPRVRADLKWTDRWGALRVRLGFGRNDYKVAPGLYAVGRPAAAAPVLVTANYKLSFDHVRSNLAGWDAWLLVLDTRGINVWCAAGKGTFGTTELVQRVQDAGLTRIVAHRRLIVPQLGATGVSARAVKKDCGFEVVWGPVRAADLKAFLAADGRAATAMRRVSFTWRERLILIPVELTLARKYIMWALAVLFLLSGLGPHLFSITWAWQRGWQAVVAGLAGVLAGCVIVPLLLPWLPGRAFAMKGMVAGLATGLLALVALRHTPGFAAMSATALLLLAATTGSYTAMNFTGSTPFTSPSGVEKEMRCAIPLQLAAGILAVVLWVGAGFRL